MSCIYKYKGKDYTKDGFYSLVATTMVQPKTVPKYVKVFVNNGQENTQFSFKSPEIVNNELFDAAYKTLNHKNAEIFASMLQHIVPNLKIKIISNEEIIESKKFSSDGYVEDGIIYLNRDKFTNVTGIHELGHILEPVLKASNNEVYLKIMNTIEEGMNNKGSDIDKLASIIISKHKAAGIPMSNQRLKSELFAELLAMNSESEFMRLLQQANDINAEQHKGLLKSLYKVYDNILKAIKNIFGKGALTLEDLFVDLARDIVKNGGSYLNNENMNFVKRYYRDYGMHARMEYDSAEKASKNIESNESLHDLFIGKEYKLNTADDIAIDIVNNFENRGMENGFYMFHYDGKEYKFNGKLTRPELILEVKSQLADKIYQSKISQKGRLVESLNSEKNPIKGLEKIAGLNTSIVSIESIAKYTGIHGGYKAAYTIQDLKNSGNKDLQKLATGFMSDYDGVVIVHNIEDDGTVDISIIDITPNQISPRKMTLEDNSIFGNYMTTADYNRDGKNLNGPTMMLRNTDADVKNFQIALFILNAKKQLGDKVKFRNLGVLSIEPRNTSAKMIHDINGLLNNVKIMGKNSTLIDAIKDDGLKDLIINVDKYSQNVRQSFMSQVVSYFNEVEEANISDDFLTPYYIRELSKSLFGGKININDKFKVIDGAIRHIRANYNGDPAQNTLYYLLNGLSRELKTGDTGMANALKDISSLQVKLMTADNVNNMYVQDIVEAVKNAKFKIVAKIKKDIRELRGTKDNPGLFAKVLNKRFDILLKTESLFVNRGSNIFSHMYKTQELNVIKDDKVVGKKKVIIPKLHHTIKDADTKELYNKGVITDDDLALANEILDRQKELWIEKMMHNDKIKSQERNLLGKTESTKEQFSKEYDSQFNRGDIVTIDLSSTEMITKGNFKGAIKREIDKVSMNDYIFDETIDLDNADIDKLSDFFGSQFSAKNRLNKVGLNINEHGEMYIANELLNETMSTNLWDTYFYLNQSVTRKIIYENEVMPVVETSITFLKQLEVMGMSQDNNLRYIKEYIDSNAFRRNQDDDNSPVPKIARSLSKTYSRAVLPFKLSIGVFSMAFNINRILTESLASTLAQSQSVLPKLNHFLNGAKYLLSPKHFNTMRRLSLDLQLWNGDERELINSPIGNNPTKRKFYDEAFTNIFNWATDSFTRALAMAAKLSEQGSLDAYSYDKVSGNVLYDERKDLKFYTKDGEFKPEMKAEYNRIKESLKQEGLEGVKIARGEDMVTANNMKYIADNYLIGAFSTESRANITNTWLGMFMSQFRLFSVSRLNNAGLFAASSNATKLGGQYKHITLPDGTVISRREVMEKETMLRSLGQAYNSIVKDGNMTPAKFHKWYLEQSDSRRFNLVKTFIQLSMFTLMFLASRAIDDDDDQSNDYLMNKFLGDVFIMGTVVDFAQNPFPSINALIRTMDQGKVTNFLPGSGAVEEFIETITPEE